MANQVANTAANKVAKIYPSTLGPELLKRLRNTSKEVAQVNVLLASPSGQAWKGIRKVGNQYCVVHQNGVASIMFDNMDKMLIAMTKGKTVVCYSV